MCSNLLSSHIVLAEPQLQVVNITLQATNKSYITDKKNSEKAPYRSCQSKFLLQTDSDDRLSRDTMIPAVRIDIVIMY